MIQASKILVYHLNFVLLFTIFFSCESVKREPIDESALPEEVSLSNDIIPIFEQKCIKCHNGGTPPDLTSENAYIDLTAGGYINIYNPEESTLYEAINTGGSMQQYADDFNRAIILKWITQGAFEN